MYDDDDSGSVSIVELGHLIKEMFPNPTAAMRPRLEEIFAEINNMGSRSLNFKDFVLAVGQLRDIQLQEKIDREKYIVELTAFTSDEVRSFREVFMRGNEDGDTLISFPEVRVMVARFCALGEKNNGALIEAFNRTLVSAGKCPQPPKTSGEPRKTNRMLASGGVLDASAPDSGIGAWTPRQTQGRSTSSNALLAWSAKLDFPDFLVFMRELVDTNFANINATDEPPKVTTVGGDDGCGGFTIGTERIPAWGGSAKAPNTGRNKGTRDGSLEETEEHEKVSHKRTTEMLKTGLGKLF
jgi:Ca2+-binding EF-hand superfamily protein